MIAIEKTNNTGKLLVAVLAMIVIMTGAVMLSSCGVQAVDGDTTTTEGLTADEFLALADDNNVITLESDTTVVESVTVSESLTIVLNGYTLSYKETNPSNLFVNGSNNPVEAGASNITLKIDGTVEGSEIVSDGRIAFFYADNCSLIINGGTYKSDSYGFIWYDLDVDNDLRNNLVSVTDATVESGQATFWLSNRAIANAVFTNSVMTTTLPGESEDSVGFYLGTVQNTKITNCEIHVTGNGSALEIKAGNVTVSNSVITADTYNVSNDVGTGGSGGSVSAVTINNQYDSSTHMGEINVFFYNTEITNSADNSKPIIITTNVDGIPVYVAWEGHGSDDYAISGTVSNQITIGTMVTNNADGTVNSDSINSAFSEDVTEVAISEGTITSGSTLEVPADGTLTISPDVVIEDGASFEVAEGGNVVVQNVDDSSFSIVGNGNTVATFTGVTGSFTITGGSVNINGEIAGSIDISGIDVSTDEDAINVEITGTITDDLTISGTGNVTFNNITINEGVKVTLGGNIDYQFTGTYSNSGTIENNTDFANGYYVDMISVTSVGTLTGTGMYALSDDTAAGNFAVKVYRSSVSYYAYGTSFNGTIDLVSGDIVVLGAQAASGNVEVVVESENGSQFVLTAQGDRVYDADPIQVTGSSTPVNNVYADSSVTINAVKDDVSIIGVVVLGDVDISKTITVGSGANLVIPNNTEVMFTATANPNSDDDYIQGSIALNSGFVWIYGTLTMGQNVTATDCITGTGTVKAVDTDAVSPFLGTGLTATPIEATIEISNAATAYNMLLQYKDSGLKIRINVEITVPTGDTLDLTNANIEFGPNGGLILNNRSITNITDSVLDKTDVDNNNADIVVNAGARLNITDSKIFMVVQADKNAIVNVDNADVTYDNTTSDVKVGYGTTLYLSGTPTDDVEVYGTLDISGTVTISSGITLTVYPGATMNVTGTMNVAGKMVFQTGSTVEISGTVTVDRTMGGAGITSSGDFTIAADGTLTVRASDERYGQDNYLGISAGEFTVEGTLNMYGTLSGAVLDKGTIVLDGKVGTATISVFDGVTLNITSVVGNLTINDASAASTVNGPNGRYGVAQGNSVTMTEAENVVVTVSVQLVGTGDNRTYVSSMDVFGTFSGSTTIASGYAYSSSYGYGVTVSGTIDNEGALTFGQNVLVSGTVNAVAEGATITVAQGGQLTVTGQIVIGGEDNTNHAILNNGTLNATYYTVTTGPSTARVITGYYGAFDAIVQDIADADNDTITVYGAQTVGADATIASGQTVAISSGATLTVGKDYVLTFQTGSTMDNSGTAVATGMLVFDSFTTTYGRSDEGISAEVVVIEDPARTYMSLGVAIDSGMTDITLNQDVVITEDLTIPEGVTVTGEDKTFTINAEENDVTLTVNGTLTLVDGSNIVRQNDDADQYDAEIVVSGNLMVSAQYTDDQGATQSVDDMYDVEGAHFYNYNGIERVYNISNVAYAAANCDEGTITITGNVTAGEVTFAADENGTGLTVEVINIMDGNTVVKNSTFVATSVTLDGAKMDLNNANTGVMTGAVITAAGQIDLTRASGIEIVSTTDATDDSDVMTVTGTVTGTVTVASGTVDVTGSLSVGSTASLTVANGATLVVPAQASVSGRYNPNTEAYTFVVDGTIEFDDGTLDGLMEVNGTMLVSEDMTVDGVDIALNGTITVAADKALTVGDMDIDGTSIEAGAASVITGSIEFGQYGFIVAYPGADLTGAVMEWNSASSTSDANSTEYYVNGELYVTMYAGASTAITYDEVVASGIQMSGYSTVYGWYATQEDADKRINGDMSVTAIDRTIGTDAQVYGAANIANVYGTVSVGTGITMYIDGLTIENWYDYDASRYYLPVGEHTVTIAANANYNIDNATITFNGQTVQNGGTITVEAGANSFTLAASGAVASTPGSGDITVNVPSQDDGMSLTDILLIVLVILILVMAIIVALRLMRS